MTSLLKHVDNLVLVLWEHLGESIGMLNKVTYIRSSH
jgi:hypothetical protein